MLNNFHFDYEAFYERLLTVSRKAFIDLQNSHEDEHFYLFGLFTDAENMSIGIVAYSEEKLTELAQKQLAKDRTKRPELQEYISLNLEDVKIYLRYQLGSDAYLCPYDLLFADINDSLVERFHPLFELWSMALQNGDRQILEEVGVEEEKYDKVCCDVLKQLDLEHIFGAGEVRERIYLTFLNGDLDCSNNSCADLNPKAVIERYSNEFKVEKDVNKTINENWERRQDYIHKMKISQK